MDFPVKNLILGSLLVLHVSAGILFPEEFINVIGLAYSRLPPTKIGTDSRLGFGFRLGRNADAQFLIELGPQSNTIPLGSDTNSKRDINSNIEHSFSGIWKNRFRNRYKYNVVTQIPIINIKTTTTSSSSSTTTTTTTTTTESGLNLDNNQKQTPIPIDLPVYLSDKFLVNDRKSANTSKPTNSLELINKYKNLYPVFSVNVFKLVNSLMHILPDSKT